MLHNYSASFPCGSIITGQQLQLLNDQPQKYLQFQYIDYSDGIISGMNFSKSDGELQITPGIYKYRGKFYILEENCTIKITDSQFDDGQHYSVLLSASEEKVAPDIIDYNLELVVKKSNSVPGNSPDLMFTFYGKPRLPKYCKDIFSENMDLLSVAQSACGEATYSKYLFGLVYQYLTGEKKSLHTLDYILIDEISKCGYVPITTMKNYITATGQPAPETGDRRLFFRTFVNSLDLLEGENKTGTPKETNIAETDTSEGFFF